MIRIVTVVMEASWTLLKFHSHVTAADNIDNIITSKASVSYAYCIIITLYTHIHTYVYYLITQISPQNMDKRI